MSHELFGPANPGPPKNTPNKGRYTRWWLTKNHQKIPENQLNKGCPTSRIRPPPTHGPKKNTLRVPVFFNYFFPYMEKNFKIAKFSPLRGDFIKKTPCSKKTPCTEHLKFSPTWSLKKNSTSRHQGYSS